MTHVIHDSGGKLKRDARVIGLLFASTTSMIGSGWLFGAFHAAKIAGPLSVWSWVVGAVIILLIALCFAELSTLFPRAGALVHMSHASHGAQLGRLWGWMLFLSYVAVPAVEAEAIVTYASNYIPQLLQPGTSGLLSVTGFIACAALVGVMALLNLLAVRKLLSVNSTITWWKIAVPLLTVVVLIISSTHWGVWSADPNPAHFDGIFTALPAAGIVFSYLGFRTAIDLGGETANPGRNMPIAVIGSVVLSAFVYILLQVAFLMALSPDDMANGWANLTFTGAAGPFAGLAASLGIGWLATLLYVDAFVSPGGTGLMYVTGGSRILFGVGEMGAGPKWLMWLNSAEVPWLAVAVMWIVGVLFLLPFPAWQLLVSYITSITVLTYGLGPIVLVILRRSQPDLHRPFRLSGAGIIAPVAFICCNWVILWAGFTTNTVLFIIILIGFALYVLHHYLIAHKSTAEFGWGHIAWLGAWFGGMWILSWFSDIDGGIGILGFWWEVLVVAIWSLIVIELAKRAAVPAEETAQLMAEIERLD